MLKFSLMILSTIHSVLVTFQPPALSQSSVQIHIPWQSCLLATVPLLITVSKKSLEQTSKVNCNLPGCDIAFRF
jgi:hypothetical protein